MRLSTLILTAGLACLPLATLAEEALREIIVTGEGEVAVEPDMAVLTLGVSHDARTAKEAMDGASAGAAEVLATLEEAGIASRDIQTSSISLSPRWDHSMRDAPPKVAGYVASNTLSVRVRDLESLGGVLDSVVGSGANQMHGLSFALAEPRPAMDQARTKAVQDAVAKATLLADAAGLTLGPIRRISEASVGGPVPIQMQGRAMMEAASVPISSGELDVRASVTVVFDIAP